MIDAAALVSIGIAGEWAHVLNDAMDLYEIDTKGRASMWVAQCAHESQAFTRLVENLNYSASGLFKTFPKYFTEDEAEDFAYEPELIANRVYANRLGNGNEASGDGYKFCGRGLIQITGRANYRACGLALKIDLLTKPELLEVPRYAAESGGWFWSSHGCNELADAGNFLGTTRVINGPRCLGQKERLAWLAKTQAAMSLTKEH